MNMLFIKGIVRDKTDNESGYPYAIPAVRDIEKLSFSSPITFLVGENGSGKSTIVETLAVLAGFNAEGGTKNYSFSTQDTTSPLINTSHLLRGALREKYGYFLRAESFYTTANYAETGTEGKHGPIPILFNGKHIHEQSHGEAFLSIVESFKNGLFLFDEPESALSPQRLLRLMHMMHNLEQEGSQFIIATHSPILLAYPGAMIYELSKGGISRVDYHSVEHVNMTRDFLNNTDAYIHKLFNE